MKRRMQIQRRKFIKRERLTNEDLDRMKAKAEDRVNCYDCDTCKRFIVTIDRDKGTTPMTLNCRATAGCQGTMYSAMYQVPTGLIPTHEWYKPDKLPCAPGMRDHVQRGGLLIREIDHAE